MKLPTPAECLAIHASGVAAMSAAFAPLYGNNPAEMGPRGFIVGFLTGLPAFAYAVALRRRRAARR